MMFGRKNRDSYEIEALLKAVRDLKRENGELQQALLKGGGAGTAGGDYSIIGLTDGILKLNREREVSYMNTCMAELLSVNRKTAVGEPLAAIDTEPTLGAGCIRGLVDAADAAGGETAVQMERTAPGGDREYYYVTVRALSDGGSQILFENVSPQKLTELELKEKENQLRESQKMQAIGTLAGGVAHDFNNLLTIIQVNAELLELELGISGGPAAGYLDDIRQTVHNAGNLARQLLVFSRRKALSFRTEDLNEISTTMMKMLGRVLGEKVTVETDFNGSVSAVRADRGSIEQVLLNLAINARDAMPDGGTLSLATGCSVSGGSEGTGEHVWLQVSDTGCGMTAETRQRIFEPFFTTKSAGRGTGLGLSVVYGIIKEHGGRIEVESEVGHGTTFRVFIPAAAAGELPVADDAAVAVPAGRGERILLVEDHEEVRKGTAGILSKSGYRVDEAADEAEARAMLAGHGNGYRLLFSDVVLPDGSGMTLANLARETHRINAVVLYSSHLDDDMSEQMIRDRGYVFIRKPFNRSELLTTVRSAIDATEPLDAGT